MLQKNYYKILQVSPQCTQEEIKKAYRKLALQFHPDINHKTTQIFNEIKEAYEVLGNATSRSKYNTTFFYYLVEDKNVNIHSIVQQTYQLTSFIQSGNRFTMDYEMIATYIQHILQPLQVNLFQTTAEKDKYQQIENNLYLTAAALPFHQYQKVYTLLSNVFPNKINLYNKLLKQKKQNWLGEKYAILIAITMTIMLCFIIAYLS